MFIAYSNDKELGTYQIWSSGLDDEEMRNATHGEMFAQNVSSVIVYASDKYVDDLDGSKDESDKKCS